VAWGDDGRLRRVIACRIVVIAVLGGRKGRWSRKERVQHGRSELSGVAVAIAAGQKRGTAAIKMPRCTASERSVTGGRK
jgi:hypothetical protein